MKTISEIYEHYKIMPFLQTHMRRVAGVAAIICDNIDAKVNRDDIISACLLHDIGNIIKFDPLLPESLGREGLAYWQNVQNEFKNKYSTEHKAHVAISKEIGASKRTIDLVENVGISKSQILAADGADIAKKICCYSDMRVGTHGVLSLANRLADLKQRYSKKFFGVENDKQNEIWRKALYKIEQDIFNHSKIKPEDVNDDSIAPYIADLKNFRVV